MINKFIGIGRTGKEVEIQTLQSGNKVAKVSVAITEKYTKNGEKVEETQWLNLEAWGKLADIFEQYVKKGDLIFFSGKVKIDQYEKDGQKMSATKIVVYEMQMLGSKSQDLTQPSSTQSRNQPVYEDDSESLPF